MKSKRMTTGRYLWLLIIFLVVIFVVVFFQAILRKIGHFVVLDDHPVRCDVVLVLNTELEYYPRLIEAAAVFQRGLAERVVINGNRKTESLRELEAKGFSPSCPWYADSVRILKLLGVPEDNISWISAEDVYDSVSEAEAVGNELLRQGVASVIITTSRFHSRRARAIWRNMYEGRLSVYMVSAKTDPYDPNKWWQDGRQIRWVLAEYGAWVYYWWKSLT